MYKQIVNLDIESLTKAFFQDNLDKHKLESRIGQYDMALEIASTISNNKHIIVEGGVGIGKSLAYLVPAFYLNMHTGKPIAISTSTIALEEQLEKDIKNVSQMLEHNPEVVLAKGKTHFFCSQKARNILKKDRSFNVKYPWIENFLNSDIPGDYNELPGNINKEDWQWLHVEECFFEDCNSFHKCEFYRRRMRMQNTCGIIICNHNLLIADASKRAEKQPTLLPKSLRLVIIDEAHALEEKLRHATSQSFSLQEIKQLINNVVDFFHAKQKHIKSLDRVEKINKELLNNSALLFKNFIEDIEEQREVILNENTNYKDTMQKYFAFQEENKEHNKEKRNISKKLSRSFNCLTSEVLSIKSFRSKEPKKEQELLIEKLENATLFFDSLSQAYTKDIFWLEQDLNFQNLQIAKCPKNLADISCKLFFDSGFSTPAKVLTSATLVNDFNSKKLEKKYSYIIKTTGFPTQTTFGVLSTPKPSPFSYKKNTLLYCPEGMPHPIKDRLAFMEEATKEIQKVTMITKGKSLILFTAKEDMEYIYQKLLKMSLPWKLLKQQKNSSQDQVIKEFIVNQDSILLGTGVLWEGIDIPGPSLSHVIVVKLPFPVPDPILKHKNNLRKDSHFNEMILKLRQGCGRLIRNEEDAGIITLLDPRAELNQESPFFNLKTAETIRKALPFPEAKMGLEDVKEFAKRRIL